MRVHWFLLLLFLGSCSSQCDIEGCWFDGNGSNGNCTSRCSDRCFPGEFPFLPCTSTRDLQCSDGSVLFRTEGTYQYPRWSRFFDDNTIFYVDGNAIFNTQIFSRNAVLYAGKQDQVGFVDASVTNARFSNPNGFTFVGSDIYICDTGNSAIRKVANSEVSTLPFVGLNAPLDIAYGPDGMIYFIDPPEYVIYRFSVNNVSNIHIFAGTKGVPGVGEGPLSIVKFWELSSIEAADTKIYVTEYTQCTLRSIDLPSMTVDTIVGASGVCDPVCNFGFEDNPRQDSMLGITARLCRPAHVRRQSSRSDGLLIGEYFNNFSNVRLVNLTSTSVQSFMDWKDTPLSFAMSADHQYVFKSIHEGNYSYSEPLPCDPRLVIPNVSMFDCTKNLSTYGERCPGEVWSNLTCDAGCYGPTCELHCSTSCPDANEYIIQGCNSYSDIVCGTVQDPILSTVDLTSLELQSLPRITNVFSIAFRNVKEAYVSDYSNHRILRYDPVLNNISTFSGTDVAFFQDGNDARYHHPKQILVHPNMDSLIINDAGNKVIRRTFFSNGWAETVAGTPNSISKSDGTVNIGQLGDIADMVYSASDQLVYLADNFDFSLRTLNLNTTEVLTVCGGNGYAITDGYCEYDPVAFGTIYGITCNNVFVYVITNNNAGGEKLRRFHKEFLWVDTVDANMQGEPQFWLRFINDRLFTWSQDNFASNGKVVELFLNGTSNTDLMNREAYMYFPENITTTYWQPLSLSPDKQYFAWLSEDPQGFEPASWKNFLECDPSLIVPGESLRQTCKPAFSTKPCLFVDLVIETTTPSPSPSPPIFNTYEPSNEIWDMRIISRNEHEFYNLAWFCDQRNSQVNSTIGNSTLGPIHTIYVESPQNIIFGQRDTLWKVDISTNEVTKHYQITSDDWGNLGYPLITKVIGEYVVTRKQILLLNNSVVVVGSPSGLTGYAYGAGVSARFSSIEDAFLHQNYMVVDDRTLLYSMWRPIDLLTDYTAAAMVFNFFEEIAELKSFFINGSLIYGATSTKVILLDARNPSEWRTFSVFGLERGVKLLVGGESPLGFQSPLDFPSTPQWGVGYELWDIEKISRWNEDYIYIIDRRRNVFRYHIPTEMVMYLPLFPRTYPSDIVFRNILVIDNQYMVAVNGACGLSIIERGCEGGMQMQNDTICVNCKSGKYSPRMSQYCFDFVVICYAGTYAVGNNTNSSTVVCTTCPYGYACPVDHKVINNVTYQFGLPQFVPWITYCGPGTFMYGNNNATHIASCPPCPTGFSCPLGSEGSMIPWTTYCPEGTYPQGSNTAIGTTNCTICPAGNYCPSSNASNVTGQFAYPPTIIPWVTECDDGYLLQGSQQSAYCLQCGIPVDAPFACVLSNVKTDWTLYCPAGTIATGDNNATHVVECLPYEGCPPQNACTEQWMDNATGAFFSPGIIPWVLGCDAGYFLNGSNSNSSVAECLECPSEKACVGDGKISDWVYACDPGYFMISSINNATHFAECVFCPWNHTCLNYTTKVPWVWTCPAGTYGVGANTENSTARCLSPCPVAYHACMGNTATILDSNHSDGDGYEVSFLSTGITPWTTYCPKGTYPDTNNTDSSLTNCLPCPSGYACVNETIALAENDYLFFYSLTSHVTSCPEFFYISGENNSTHVATCVRCMPDDDECNNATSGQTRMFRFEMHLYGDFLYDIMDRSQAESAILSALKMYPSNVYVYEIKNNGVHTSVTIRSVVVVPRQDVAYMLALGYEGVLSNDYMVNFFEFEIGYLGLMMELIRPVEQDALGIWFVELGPEQYTIPYNNTNTYPSSSDSTRVQTTFWVIGLMCIIIMMYIYALLA